MNSPVAPAALAAPVAASKPTRAPLAHMVAGGGAAPSSVLRRVLQPEQGEDHVPVAAFSSSI